jgi:cytochrome P450
MAYPSAPNIASAQFNADPFPFYARLRDESPVYRTAVGRNQDAWLVTRYNDVNALLKDERFVKDRRRAVDPAQPKPRQWQPRFVEPLLYNMLYVDPPDHTRLRALVHKAFTPRLIENMRERVRVLTHEYIDAAERRGRFDLIADYALPLPVNVISDMLGVPPNGRHRFARWSQQIMKVTNGREFLLALPHLWAFMRYLRHLIVLRKAEPRDDLLTALVQAEEGGDALTQHELVAMIFLLLIAGHETTVNLIGNGVLALTQHPEQWEMLRRDPALVKPAIEELLRFSSPVFIATDRYAREDAEIAGTTIPRGALVYAVLGSANRDHAQFPDADTLDLTRTPNRHLAFGQGIHYCLGAPLARLEGQIAFTTLLERMPNLQLATAPDALRWRSGVFVRGVHALPLAV